MFKVFGEGEEFRFGEEFFSIVVGGIGDVLIVVLVEIWLVGVDGCGRVGYLLGELIVWEFWVEEVDKDCVRLRELYEIISGVDEVVFEGILLFVCRIEEGIFDGSVDDGWVRLLKGVWRDEEVFCDNEFVVFLDDVGEEIGLCIDNRLMDGWWEEILWLLVCEIILERLGDILDDMVVLSIEVLEVLREGKEGVNVCFEIFCLDGCVKVVYVDVMLFLVVIGVIVVVVVVWFFWGLVDWIDVEDVDMVLFWNVIGVFVGVV